jgi:hypothetical protein
MVQAVAAVIVLVTTFATPASAALHTDAGILNLLPDGQTTGPYYIVNKATGKCLDAHAGFGGGNNNPVGLWDCNNGVTERWYFTDNRSSGPYWIKITNAGSGRCLDYPASSGGANGWQYVLWDCVGSAGSTGQRFWPYWHTNTSDFDWSVELGTSANLMDAFASGGGGNGNPVGNWGYTGSNLQRWTLVHV